MKNFKNVITFTKNMRGCCIVDTIKGCKHDCYGDCYAKRSLSRYGFNFASPKKRSFTSDKFSQLTLFGFYNSNHEQAIIADINNSDMPFVRIGDMGDPSEDWEHTVKVLKVLLKSEKKVVIITKHWKPIPARLLKVFKPVTLNTSVSALDTPAELRHRLSQYERLKGFCNSVLRVVSCDFNKNNPTGSLMTEVQTDLLGKEKVIDTIFRPSLNNPLVVNGIIKTKRIKFLKSFSYASISDKNNYFGYCDNCPDMCGIYK